MTTQGWGTRPEDMPDMCHDHCVPNGLDETYLPYAWVSGVGRYRCRQGHNWTCSWGHTGSGVAPGNAGMTWSDAAISDAYGDFPTWRRYRTAPAHCVWCSDSGFLSIEGRNGAACKIVCPFCLRRLALRHDRRP